MPTTDSQQELLTEVDQYNKVIGPIPRGLAHTGGKYYRTVSIFVKKGDKYLWQKRSATKDLYPNCWDFSVGGHVDFGHSYIETAIRELQEEIGLRKEEKDLILLGEILVTLPNSNEYFHVFECEMSEDDKLNIPEEEVSEIMWMSMSDVRKSILDGSIDWYPRPLQIITRFYQNQ